MKAQLRLYQPTRQAMAQGRVPATLWARRESGVWVHASSYCLRGLEVTRAVWGATLGRSYVVITSVVDGRHTNPKSDHYLGNAWDIRKRDLRVPERRLALQRLREELGEGYYVIEERTHFHAAWRPQGPAAELGA